jgi:hypothetical protein
VKPGQCKFSLTPQDSISAKSYSSSSNVSGGSNGDVDDEIHSNISKSGSPAIKTNHKAVLT